MGTLVGATVGAALSYCSAAGVRWQSESASWLPCCSSYMSRVRPRQSWPDMSVASSYCLTVPTRGLMPVPRSRNVSGHRDGRAREPCPEADASGDTRRTDSDCGKSRGESEGTGRNEGAHFAPCRPSPQAVFRLAVPECCSASRPEDRPRRRVAIVTLF